MKERNCKPSTKLLTRSLKEIRILEVYFLKSSSHMMNTSESARNS